jgi:hypothetical protein
LKNGACLPQAGANVSDSLHSAKIPVCGPQQKLYF